ncbi:WYL domain-containing protein [bacterium]|nr:WYL domain-containing protein [bacterium]
MKEPTENRIQRLQWIQMTLSAKHCITRQEIMDRFEIGRTAANDDLRYFRNFNIIRWSHANNWHELIDEPKSLPGLFISQKEWLVLTFTELMLSKHATAFSKELQKFQSRYKKDMNRLLPVSDISHYFSVNLTRIEHIDDITFETCIYAVVRQVSLRILYHKPFEDEIVERIISPYHLVNEGGSWLMVSWDHDKKELRNFMPSRIKTIYPEIGADFVKRPFSEIEKHLSGSYGLYKGEKREDAVLLFSKQKSIWAERQKWHENEKKQWVGKQLKLTIPIASQEGIMEEILSHGPDIEVIAPRTLRELTISRINQTQTIYK